MAFRREPNPNRNHPQYCPYCGGTELFPDGEGDFAWSCDECLRVFSVMFHGQNDPDTEFSPAPSTEEAYERSLRKHGHSEALAAIADYEQPNGTVSVAGDWNGR